MYVLYSTLLWCCKTLKMLVFDRTRPFSLFWHLCYTVQRYSLFTWYQCIISLVLMSVLRVLWMSTHGCSAILFPIPTWWYIRRWSPGARCHCRSFLPGGSRWYLLLDRASRPGVDRWLPGRRPAPFRSVSRFVLAFLRHPWLTMSVLKYYVCMTYVFGPPCPWFVIWDELCLNSCLELCCDPFPWVSVPERARLRVWLVHD